MRNSHLKESKAIKQVLYWCRVPPVSCVITAQIKGVHVRELHNPIAMFNDSSI